MKKDFSIGVLVTVLFFSFRLINLGAIPIFTDEAIYLRWSQIMVTDASLRYLPLVDGKPPLFMWTTSIVMKVLPHIDPLLTGRLTAVGSGFLALCGVVFTSWIIFKNRRVSLLAAVLYIFVPFTFFYDRFGLADSMLAMWGIWSLGLSVLLVQTLRLDVAMILGMIIGFGFLTKSPALFFLVFSPLSIGFFNFKSTHRIRQLMKLVSLFLVVVVISQGIYSILRLFPLFNMIGQKNLEFAIPVSELLKNPFMYLFGNLKALVSWEVGYLTLPVSLLVIWAGIKGLIKRSYGEILLSSCFVIFTLAMAAANKVIYPRFLLIFTPGLLILGALSLSQFKKWSWVILIAILIIPIYTDIQLMINPITAPIPDADSGQYINGWAAGYGVKDVRNFLASQPGKTTIITEGTFGLMPYSLDLYQKDYPNVEIKSYWPLPKQSEIVFKNPTYLLIYQHEKAPEDWKVKLINSYQQGTSPEFLKLYQVLPSS